MRAPRLWLIAMLVGTVALVGNADLNHTSAEGIGAEGLGRASVKQVDNWPGLVPPPPVTPPFPIEPPAASSPDGPVVPSPLPPPPPPEAEDGRVSVIVELATPAARFSSPGGVDVFSTQSSFLSTPPVEV